MKLRSPMLKRTKLAGINRAKSPGAAVSRDTSHNTKN